MDEQKTTPIDDLARTFNEFRAAADRYMAVMDHAVKIDKATRESAVKAAAALEQASLVMLDLAQSIRAREERLQVSDGMN